MNAGQTIADAVGARWDGQQQLPFMNPMWVFSDFVLCFTIYVPVNATYEHVARRMADKRAEFAAHNKERLAA